MLQEADKFYLVVAGNEREYRIWKYEHPEYRDADGRHRSCYIRDANGLCGRRTQNVEVIYTGEYWKNPLHGTPILTEFIRESAMYQESQRITAEVSCSTCDFLCQSKTNWCNAGHNNLPSDLKAETTCADWERLDLDRRVQANLATQSKVTRENPTAANLGEMGHRVLVDDIEMSSLLNPERNRVVPWMEPIRNPRPRFDYPTLDNLIEIVDRQLPSLLRSNEIPSRLREREEFAYRWNDSRVLRFRVVRINGAYYWVYNGPLIAESVRSEAQALEPVWGETELLTIKDMVGMSRTFPDPLEAWRQGTRDMNAMPPLTVDDTRSLNPTVKYYRFSLREFRYSHTDSFFKWTWEGELLLQKPERRYRLSYGLFRD